MTDVSDQVARRKKSWEELLSDSNELRMQLHAARYYTHKLIIKKYGDVLAAGLIDEERARELYAEAMANYDGVIKDSVQGHAAEAMERSISEGFVV